jgi:hypothetical protein
MEKDDKTAAFYTDRDAGQWVEKAIAYAKEQRVNVVIEGMMRDNNKVAKTEEAAWALKTGKALQRVESQIWSMAWPASDAIAKDCLQAKRMIDRRLRNCPCSHPADAPLSRRKGSRATPYALTVGLDEQIENTVTPDPDHHP